MAKLHSGGRQGPKLAGPFSEARGSSRGGKAAQEPGPDHGSGPQGSNTRALEPGSWFKSHLQPNFLVPPFSYMYNQDKIVLSS